MRKWVDLNRQPGWIESSWSGARRRPPGFLNSLAARTRNVLTPARARNEGKKAGASPRVRIAFRPYQWPVFHDRSSGIMILHWSRQIGKSFTLAAWAVDRLLTRPGRLVTVLSNSRDNGAEFVAKCAEVCRLNGTEFESVDKSRGVQFQNMRMEVRIRANGRTGRIKVLAANPRTARGFSGDLILDEFAFHEDSQAIWEAAEPILASNPDFLCRIASTGNGKHNLFYRMTANAPETFCWKPTERPLTPAQWLPKPATSQLPKGDVRLRETWSPDGGEGREPMEHPKSKNQHPAHKDGPSRPLTPTLSPDGGEGEEPTEHPKSNHQSPPRKDVPSRPLTPALSPDGGEGEEHPESNDQPANECLGVLVSAGIAVSRAGFKVSRITRTQAWQTGVKIYDANTRESITPETARAQALDKRAYDQNYECAFADENLTLLSHELIDAAEREDAGVICEQDWSNCVSGTRVKARRHTDIFQQERGRAAREYSDGMVFVNALELLRAAVGCLYAGFDVARRGDLSVITVVEDLNGLKVVRAILRMQDLRLPEQQARLGEICRLPKFRRAAIDMTGLGLGLFEYAQKEFGRSRIAGINFASSVPATAAIRAEGRGRETVRVTEALALELLQTYEDRRIQHPADGRLRDDLRKPEKITTPGGRVSIAATRDEAGHADHFWSFALALEAAAKGRGMWGFKTIERVVKKAWL